MVKARIAVALCLFAGTASAQVPDEVFGPPLVDRWSLTPLIGTTVGLDVGGGFQIEAPCRLRFMATAGWMPRGYAHVQSWFLDESNVLTSPQSVVQKDLVTNSLVVRGNLSMRPIWDLGFFFGGGYSYQRASQSSISAGELENANTVPTPVPLAMIVPPNLTFSSTTQLHLVDLFVGWQWGLGLGLTVRISVGVIKVVDARTTYVANFTPPSPAALAAFTQSASKQSNDAGEGIVAPEGSLYVGYTF